MFKINSILGRFTVTFAVIGLKLMGDMSLKAASPATFVSQINARGIPDACVNKFSIMGQERTNAPQSSLRFIYIADRDVFQQEDYIKLLKQGDNEQVQTFILDKDIYLTHALAALPHVKRIRQLLDENTKIPRETFTGQVSRLRFLTLDLLQGSDVVGDLSIPEGVADNVGEEWRRYVEVTRERPVETYFQIDTDAVALRPLTPVMTLIPKDNATQPVYSTNLDFFKGHTDWHDVEWHRSDLEAFYGNGGPYKCLRADWPENRVSAGFLMVKCKNLRDVLSTLCSKPMDSGGRSWGASMVIQAYDEEGFLGDVLVWWKQDREKRLQQEGKDVQRSDNLASFRYNQIENTVKTFTLPYTYNSRPNAVRRAGKVLECFNNNRYGGGIYRDILTWNGELDTLKELADGKIAYLHLDQLPKVWEKDWPPENEEFHNDRELYQTMWGIQHQFLMQLVETDRTLARTYLTLCRPLKGEEWNPCAIQEEAEMSQSYGLAWDESRQTYVDKRASVSK